MHRYLLMLCPFFLMAFQPSSDLYEEALRSLEATERARIAAVNARDVETLITIEGDAVGFGRASTAPRRNDPEPFRAALEGWFGRMSRIEIELQDASFRVIANTGLVIGTLIRRETPSEGEPFTRRLRYSAVYVPVGEGWRMVQYHRSPQPDDGPPEKSD